MSSYASRRLYFGTFLTLFLAHASPARPGTLEDRLTVDIGKSEYQLDIEQQEEKVTWTLSKPGDKEKHPGYDTFRMLTIRCINNCKPGFSYQEKLDDGPIAAFRLWDASPDLITIWGSGSAYWVRVYHIGKDGITKVLEQATKSAPQFGIAEDGSPLVVLHNPDFPGTNDPRSPGADGGYYIHDEVWKSPGLR